MSSVAFDLLWQLFTSFLTGQSSGHPPFPWPFS